MAQTGYTPIQIYSSTTASQTPSASNLTNSTLGSELAINITDGKLFYKDNGGSVQVIAWKVTPTTAGGTGLTSYTAGDLLYYASGTTLSKLAIGTAYQMLGVNAGATAPSWQPSATSVLTTQGDLLYASAANTLARLGKNTTASRYLSNSGTSNNPAWAQVDLTNGVTGTLPTANGGTNLTSFTNNGIVYASSTSALTTGSALTFDGTNLSTTGKVIGAGFYTVKGSTSLNSTATTLFTCSGTAGMYYVGVVWDAGNPGAFTASAMIIWDGSNARIMQQTDGTQIKITLSGANVQAVNNFTTATSPWSYMKQVFA